MNYYKQGDAANADKIRAAFEKLGYSTRVNGWNFNSDCGVYFTNEADKSVDYTSIETFVNLIKTHPDYKELELPVEPKFKIGDWIASIDDEGDMATEKIVSFSHNKVLLVDTDGCHTEYPKTELSNFHLWSIADAKDGDVLVAHEVIVLFKEIDGLNIRTHFSYHYMNTPMGVRNGLHNKNAFRPATKDERALLFAKMKEAGYTWDSDKKELKKIELASKNSEDERIKETLKGFVKGYSAFINGQWRLGDFTVNRLINWLEKQGEK